MRNAGRPKSTRNLKLVAIRLRPEFIRALKQIAKKENLSQARVVEAALSKYGKELSV
jgi:predicted transcriptional regulator